MSGSVLVDFELEKHVTQRHITGRPEICPDQIQPNSIDLRVGSVAYRIQASFLPVGRTVKDRLEDGLKIHEIDLTKGAILERDAIYLIPVAEELNLPGDINGRINPKSSTGRLDIFCRAVCDGARAFDEIPEGYSGPVYLEVVSRSFMIAIKEGDRLCQLRLANGDPVLSDEDIENEIGRSIRLWKNGEEASPVIRNGIHFGVNLNASKDQTIGYFAKPSHVPIVLGNVGGYPSRRFWDRIHYRGSTDVVLEPDRFYIFASNERLGLGPSVCAEMLPYDAGMGELRSHYAGFFDSGFGWESNPSRIVLEIRNHHVPYMLSHGQTLFRVHIMRNSQNPRELYGAAGKGSNYQGQGLRLAKQFRRSDAEVFDIADFASQMTLFGN